MRNGDDFADADGNTANDVCCVCGGGINPGGCDYPSESLFQLSITTDERATHTSFRVKARQQIIGSGWKNVFKGKYFESSTTSIREKCLDANQCYKVVVLDSAGDGLCCEFGNGSYTVTWRGKCTTKFLNQ